MNQPMTNTNTTPRTLPNTYQDNLLPHPRKPSNTNPSHTNSTTNPRIPKPRERPPIATKYTLTTNHQQWRTYWKQKHLKTKSATLDWILAPPEKRTNTYKQTIAEQNNVTVNTINKTLNQLIKQGIIQETTL